MNRGVPSKQDWEGLRPQITEWYKTKTAEWIVDELKSYGFQVTTKMARDRFRQWNINRKYSINEARNRATLPVNRRLKAKDAPIAVSLVGVDSNGKWEKRDSSSGIKSGIIEAAPLVMMTMDNIHSHTHSNPAATFLTIEPSRAPNTPREEHHLHHTLTQVCRYLDRLVETGSWRRRLEQPALKVQKLASDAHMAISSQVYGSHRSWQDLSNLKQPAESVMPDLQCETLHPRALTALLRLVVDGSKVPKAMNVWEADTLRVVKEMLAAAAKRALQPTHPISLLCTVESGQTEELLFRQFELMDVCLFSKISHLPDGIDFVAQEQIYGSRTLASLGYTNWAEAKLNSVINDLSSHRCQYIHADAHRTLGYLQQQACGSRDPNDGILRLADKNAKLALTIFGRVGMRRSNEALYTHMCLAEIARKRQRLGECQEQLRSALEVWDANKSEHQPQGCPKLVRDLHQVLIDQQKLTEAHDIQVQYSEYFVDCQG